MKCPVDFSSRERAEPRVRGLARTLILAAALTASGPVMAQPQSDAIARAFMDICLKNAPEYPAARTKAAFQSVGKTRFPRGVGGVLRVEPGRSCAINVSPVALNSDGSKPDVPLELEKQIMTELARRVNGKISVYRPGKRNESWSVKVGKNKYRLQSIYKPNRKSWDLTLFKH